MKIVIVGSGWYGCHIYNFLKEKYSSDKLQVLILEKNQSIFDNSSNYNQNRLHLGYHYPRCNETRNICKKGYTRFIKEYRNVLDFIDNNYYCISNDSFIDYETYIKIFSNDINYEHSLIENNNFCKIDGKLINTKEKIINSEKAKSFFNKTINTNDIKFNCKVEKLENKNNKVIINDDIVCDLLLDCTYNQLQLSKKEYLYENTISLLYKRIDFTNSFDSLTIMDGPFFSLFPRDITKEIYTLTHVKYTPLIVSNDINKILNKQSININTVKKIKKKIEYEVKEYYENFNKHFEYCGYFTSFKCKNVCKNDSRTCNIEKYENIISVNCGKIIGIFEFEDYIKNIMKKYF